MSKQSRFLKEYKTIECRLDYELLLEKYRASLQFDERYNSWEVFFPSNSGSQAVIFDLDEVCGYEVAD